MDAKKLQPAKKTAAKAAGRPRDTAARAAIPDATLDLIREGGYRALTMDRIAQRSGSAKTTIYRWWTCKAEIVMEALLEKVAPTIPFPELRNGITATKSIEKQMLSVVKAFNGPTGELQRALIAEAQFDESFRKRFVQDWMLKRRAIGRRILEQGKTRGEFPKSMNTDVIIDALYGAIYYRLLIPYAPLNAEYVRDVIQAVLETQHSAVDMIPTHPQRVRGL